MGFAVLSVHVYSVYLLRPITLCPYLTCASFPNSSNPCSTSRSPCLLFFYLPKTEHLSLCVYFILCYIIHNHFASNKNFHSSFGMNNTPCVCKPNFLYIHLLIGTYMVPHAQLLCFYENECVEIVLFC